MTIAAGIIYPTGQGVEFYGFQAMGYYLKRFLLYYADYPWSIRLLYGLIMACILTMMVVFVLFMRKIRQNRKANKAYNAARKQLYNGFYSILISADKPDGTTLEQACGMSLHQILSYKPQILSRLISEICMDLSRELSNIPNSTTTTCPSATSRACATSSPRRPSLTATSRRSSTTTWASGIRWCCTTCSLGPRPTTVRCRSSWWWPRSCTTPTRRLSSSRRPPTTAPSKRKPRSTSCFSRPTSNTAVRRSMPWPSCATPVRSRPPSTPTTTSPSPSARRCCAPSTPSTRANIPNYAFRKSTSKVTREVALTSLYTYGKDGRRTFELLREKYIKANTDRTLMDQIDSLAVLQQMRSL